MWVNCRRGNFYMQRGHDMDPIEPFVLFMQSIRFRMLAYLDQHPEVDVEYFSTCVLPTMVTTCHQLIDRREGYIKTGRRGIPRKESTTNRDVKELYDRLRKLYDGADERQYHVEILIDDMQVLIELAVECFQLGAETCVRHLREESAAG